MSSLETSIETWACDRFAEVGADAVKRGQGGELDREVFWGNGLHFWVEFKKEDTGRLRPSQNVWIKYKMPQGDKFYLVETHLEVRNIISEWELKYGPARARKI